MVQILHRRLDKNNFQFKILYKFISHFNHFHHAYDFREKKFNGIQNNIYKLIYFFGYGNCKHLSMLVKYALDKFKLENYIILIKSKTYSHVTNLLKFNNKYYIFDGLGRFHVECKISNNSLIAKSLPINKVRSLLKNQYYTALNMDKKHRLSENFLKTNSHKLYEKALKNFDKCNFKLCDKKILFKFPIYKNFKIKKNGIGIYDKNNFSSNLYTKFKNVENIIYKPKNHFQMYKYGLIVDFTIKLKNKNRLINIKADNFSLKKVIKKSYYKLSVDKKLHSKFLETPQFMFKLKDYKNIDQLHITSILSNFYKSENKFF